MGLWRPKVENDYDKDVYNGDLGIVSRIDLMGRYLAPDGQRARSQRQHACATLISALN